MLFVSVVVLVGMDCLSSVANEHAPIRRRDRRPERRFVLSREAAHLCSDTQRSK